MKSEGMINDNERTFKEYLTVKNYSEKTIYGYMLYYRLFKKRRKITNNRIKSQRTVNSFLAKHNNAVARAFMRIYIKEFLERGDIIIHSKRGREIRRIMDKGLTYERYLQLRDKVVDTRLGLMMDLMFEANLRVSELLALTPNHFDFEKGEVRGFGKGRVEYIGFISDKTIKSLIEYIKTYVPADDARIFNITRQRVWQIFKVYDKVWGFHYHPHLQKHTRNVHMRDVLKLSDAERQRYNRHVKRETTVMVYGSSDVAALGPKIMSGYQSMRNNGVLEPPVSTVEVGVNETEKEEGESE